MTRFHMKIEKIEKKFKRYLRFLEADRRRDKTQNNN